MKKQRSKEMPWTPERIKNLRRRFGENQDEFCQHFRVSVDALRHWEQGRGAPSGPIEVILNRLEEDLRDGRFIPAGKKHAVPA